MAVPALPSDDSDGNDWTAAKVNAIYDHVQWWRDTRPLFKGQGTTTAGVAHATLFEVGMGSVSGTFEATPTTNVGGWTVSTSANGDGEYNIEVPEAGIYEGFWHVDWQTFANGTRDIYPRLNSASISGSRASAHANTTDVAIRQSAPFQVDCAAGDELSVEIYETNASTSGLTYTVWLSVKWVQST